MKRILKALLIFLIIIIFIYIGIKYLTPGGSYVYSEKYEFDCTESQLINIIEEFKKNHPQYIVPMSDFKDGKNDTSDYWFDIYIYFPLENQIIYFWTRSATDTTKTDIAFVSISDGMNMYVRWKGINEDLSYKDNKEIKRKFEQRILDKLNIKYKDKGNGMKIFGIQL